MQLHYQIVPSGTLGKKKMSTFLVRDLLDCLLDSSQWYRVLSLHQL